MYNVLKGSINFDYALIEKYKLLNLTENELAVILVMNHLLEEGNNFVTADTLSLKMSLSIKEIDKILVHLVEKNYLEYVDKGEHLTTSLKPLKERIIRELQIDILEQKQIIEQDNTRELIKQIMDKFQTELGRNLTPLEKERIHDWIKYGYTYDMITSSFNEALSNNKRTITAVDKILQKKAARNDIAKEGYTATNGTYHKNIEDTIDSINNKNWDK